MMKHTVDLVGAALDMYRTNDPGGKPNLVDLGLRSLRQTVGGVAPGNLVVVGAATNVGKSSILLEMAHHSTDMGLVLSKEDGADIVGVRLLARHAQVRDGAIRTNRMTPEERERVLAVADKAASGEIPDVPVVMPEHCATLEHVDKRLEEAAKLNCRWAALDFLQRFRGINENRRSEVGIVMDRFQTKCRELGMVAVVVSQLGRLGPWVKPKLSNLKESGDIENEAKLILLAHRDQSCPARVFVEVAKSSFGGGGTQFSMKYDEFGVLHEEGLTTATEYVPEAELTW